MSKNFKRITFTVAAICLILFISIGCIFIFDTPQSASAESQSEPEIVYLEPVEITEDEVIFEIPIQTKERGFSKLKYSISGKNSTITAKITNTFALGFSTIEIGMSLFSCPTTDGVGTFRTTNYTSDLNMWHSILVSANTNGQQLYWWGTAVVVLNGELQPTYVGYRVLFNEYGVRV